MAKVKTAYYCQSCGHESVKWLGKCPNCNSWNTFVEERNTKLSTAHQGWAAQNGQQSQPILIQDISVSEEPRIKLPGIELNRVLGGGLVAGALTLISGEPGIGKSTLLLQLALKLKNKKLLYISGEESEQQIKLRAARISEPFSNLYIYTETSLDQIFLKLTQLQPQLVIIDSIQTIFSDKIESSPGSISQIRECTAELLKYAKTTQVPVIIVGHITKDGSIAGPKVLEHMVDTVLQFEGDSNHLHRIVRSLKNRFGSTNEIGIFEMQTSGLKEVTNPSEILLAQRDEQLSGTTIAATMEGLRPLLIETQALVSSAVYGTPQRTSTGFDTRRLNLLLAVLEKRNGFKLGTKDVFINIAGGLKVEDPAIDLAMVCSILSSNEDIPVNPRYCFAAEVGLSGEIRPVPKLELRIQEAEKMQFEKIFVSKYNIKGLDKTKYKGIKVEPVARIEEVIEKVFA
ncbi:MAG: hypothetical protein RIQ89_1212 [Bacteroidota bacterium]|jgi:DNA repair protein RadA/Sms